MGHAGENTQHQSPPSMQPQSLLHACSPQRSWNPYERESLPRLCNHLIGHVTTPVCLADHIAKSANYLQTCNTLMVHCWGKCRDSNHGPFRRFKLSACVEMLVAMGFPFQRASKAGRVAAGDAEGAIELLTSGVKGLSHAQCHPAMESCRTPDML